MTPSMGLGYLGFQEGNYTQDTTFKHGWMQVAFLMMLQKSLGLSLRPVFGVLCWLRSLRISLMDQNCKLYPPCIAHYKVDILCAYKVGFRSPLYIPTMGDKAVFCARNMPLDLEDDFIRTLAFQFIPGWFPTRKRLNICGNAFYRPLVPFKEWP